MTVMTTTNDKRQTTINPWQPQTLQRRKQRLGDGKSKMTAPIESGGAPCRQLHHDKSTFNVAATAWQYSGLYQTMVVKQLRQQQCDAAALETAWRYSSLGNSVAVASQQCASAAALATALWCSGCAKRMQVQWFWQQLSCCHAQRNGNSIVGRCSNICRHSVW